MAAIRRILAVCVGCMLICVNFAHALMAGAPPDSPAARVDPNATASAWSGVGSVVVNGAPYSGVVVAPNFVLTAAHVGGSPATLQFVLTRQKNGAYQLRHS